MNRAEALRDLYEALEMLDARQGNRRAEVAVTVDLRDADGGLLARNLGRPEPRVALGPDWERGRTRW